MIPNPPTRTRPMITRAQVGTIKPNPRFYGHTSHISLISPIHKSPSIALSDPNWRDAMYDEYNALIKNSTLVLVSKPPNVNVVRPMCPVVKPTTIRTVLSLVLSQNFPIHQLDVKNSFLNGDLSETVIRTGLVSRRVIVTRPCSYINIVLRHVSVLKKYALELLDRAHMADCNPTRTPVDTISKLGSDEDSISDPTLYRSLVEPHLTALKRVLRYVRGTLDFGLQLYASITCSLVAYTDADWADCPTTRRSTSGYCVFLGDNLLSWSAKRQHTLSRSGAEAEYKGVSNVVAWLCNLLRELHTSLLSVTLVYCDNVSVIYMTANLVQYQRTKHIEIDIHFVRDMVARGQVRVFHVSSRYQYADIFTKGLPSALFEEFRTSLSVWPSPAQTAGAY
ncbi:ribonuclease H-like domain-containing protein [Tanacetum coccineum]|uniref:Ribonuclease H-like domain-containing protein n=1 Tax=Tanacetum coccineum TaxID=301880 RepID=A0ABQ5DMR0_9ASTR